MNRKGTFIKEKAKNWGFEHCGISKAEFLEEEAPRLESWLKEKRNGEMQYMENHFDKRLNPSKLVPGAQSVISLLYNYYPKEFQRVDSYHISKYAYGKDYHKVVKKKLLALVKELQEELGNFECRVFVDSAPVMEKAWAKKSGLGWIGKNSNLIHPQKGSFFFLAEIICDLELDPDTPIKDYCGTCTRCLDACPTEAIYEPYQVDGSKCISYFTIELKEELPENMKGKFEDWMFGCDICQDVCPWNRFSTPTLEEKFNPKPEILNYSKEDWEEITEEIFDEMFQGSAVKRTKFSGLKRNIEFLSNSKTKN